jgi:vacuole morphology and inheritance protein 14
MSIHLSVVSSLIPAAHFFSMPKPHLNVNVSSSAGPLATRSKLGRDEIKWQDLLLHFRSVQAKHEKARRQALGATAADTASFSGFSEKSGGGGDASGSGGGRQQQQQQQQQQAPSVIRPPMRRKVTGEFLPPSMAVAPPRNVLSPLNPRARGQSGSSGLNSQNAGAGMGQGQAGKQQQQLRALSVNKKP